MDPHSHTIMLQCVQPDQVCLWAGFPAVAAVPPTKVVLVSDDTNAAWRHHLFDRLFAALATAAPGDPDPEAFSGAGDGAATRMLLLVVAGHGPPSPELTDLATQWQARGSDALGIVPGDTDPRHVLPPALHRKHAVRWYRDPDETVPELLDVILLAGEERRVFISYATSDGTALAERLAGILNAQRYDVFLDRFRLAPGVDFYERIEDELVDKAMVVVVETPGALASPWVRYEVNTAITRRLGVVALNLDRQVGLVRTWHAVRESEKETWGDTPFATDHWLRLTPQELSEFQEQLLALVGRWKDRETPEDGRRRDPVFFFAHAVPAQP